MVDLHNTPNIPTGIVRECGPLFFGLSLFIVGFPDPFPLSLAYFEHWHSTGRGLQGKTHFKKTNSPVPNPHTSAIRPRCARVKVQRSQRTLGPRPLPRGKGLGPRLVTVWTSRCRQRKNFRAIIYADRAKTTICGAKIRAKCGAAARVKLMYPRFLLHTEGKRHSAGP